jgi:hypothetical protein
MPPRPQSWLPELVRFGKSASIAIVDGVETSISADDTIAFLLTFTGTLTATGIARLASLKPGRDYYVKNATSGGVGFDVSLRGPTGASGVTIPNGRTAAVAINSLGVLEIVGQLDRIVEGLSTIALPAAAATYTMSQLESGKRWVRFTGAPTAGCVMMPQYFDGAEWYFENGTAVSIDIHTSGSNISIASGVTKKLAHRGILKTVSTLT